MFKLTNKCSYKELKTNESLCKKCADMIYNKGKCPFCGEQLIEGPRGGLSVNVKCKNGHMFNVTLFGLIDVIEN